MKLWIFRSIRIMKFVLLVLLMTPGGLRSDSSVTKERTVTTLAKDIYVIRHKDAPDGFPQGNTTVIIGDREIFVVDSCYLPSSAREDIAQIRTWTDKPIRYLLNTHWHYDHTMGNGSYAEAFPTLSILAHRETKQQIEGYNPGWFARYPQITAALKKKLETGEDEKSVKLTPAQLKETREALKGRDQVGAEFRTLHDQIPGTTFDEALNIDLGNRQVEVRFLGKGNTAGDTIVYLPKERILITGDLLDHPVPYLGGGFPVDLVKTLRALERLDAQTLVPGHGEVLHDKVYLRQVIEFIDSIVKAVSHQIFQLGNGSRRLAEIRAAVMKEVDIEGWRKIFGAAGKDDLDFFNDFSLAGVITSAHAQLCGR